MPKSKKKRKSCAPSAVEYVQPKGATPFNGLLEGVRDAEARCYGCKGYYAAADVTWKHIKVDLTATTLTARRGAVSGRITRVTLPSRVVADWRMVSYCPTCAW